MKRNAENWLRAPNVNPRWCLGVVVFWSIILGLLSQTQLASDITNKITLSSYFKFRNYLEKNQEIDKRIKVFAFDDRSVFALKRPSLTMLEWINLIKEIDKQKPKMIIFDLMFSILNIPEAEYDATMSALRDLDSVNAKIVTGSYSSVSKNRIRKEIALDDPDFNPRSYLKLPSNKEQLQLKNYETVSFNKNDKYILGPDQRLRPHLDHIGNIEYDHSGGAVFYPFIKVSNEYVLPHLMMYASKSVEFYRGNIYVNRKLLPVKEDNSAYINYAAPLTYYKKIKPMIRLLDDRTRANPVSPIIAGKLPVPELL